MLQGGGGNVLGGSTKKVPSSLTHALGLAKPTISYAVPATKKRTLVSGGAYVAPRAAASAAPAVSSAGGGGSSGSGGGSGYRSSSRGGGGSGGGSGSSSLAAAVTAPVVSIPSLSDYINKSYLLSSVTDENTRKLADYDAQTLADKQDTAADQAKRTAYLQQNLDQQGNDNAESFASRGLGRSGLVFQGQDKIDAAGNIQKDGIASLMTDLMRTRQTGRLQQAAAARQARIDAISKLTDAYNTAVANGTASTLTSQ